MLLACPICRAPLGVHLPAALAKCPDCFHLMPIAGSYLPPIDGIVLPRPEALVSSDVLLESDGGTLTISWPWRNWANMISLGIAIAACGSCTVFCGGAIWLNRSRGSSTCRVGTRRREIAGGLASSWRSLRLPLSPARAAIFSCRIDGAFGHFVPPLLLRGRPNLVDAAIGAGEWNIRVVTILDEWRRRIAIVWRELFRIHKQSIARFLRE